MDRVCSICGGKVGKWDGPYVTIETLIMCHGEIFWSEQDRWIKTKTYYCKKCWEKHQEEVNNKSCLNCAHYNVCVHISESDDYTEAKTCNEFLEE